jgi:hypothetical protein
MSILAAKEELLSMTETHRDMHVQSSLNEEFVSEFARTFQKSTWYSTTSMKLACVEDGEEVAYAVNTNFHLLIYTYMCLMLPAIRVKSEYKKNVRIAWCHNVGTNLIQQAVFKEDDDMFQRWDSTWADIYFQFYQSEGAGKRDNHNIGIGNVKFLEEWTDYLPAYPIDVAQPWFYSMDRALAFPIFYKNSQTRAEHRYTFNRNINYLLRCQIFDNKTQKWRNATRAIHRYLDIGPSSMLKLPELWGRYAYLTPQEIQWYKCNKSRVFYIRDVEVCDTQNPNKYGSTAEVSLHSRSPCLAFFWVAENKDAKDIHNHSNYTTNVDDIYKGWDPIRSVSLKYGTVARLDNVPSHHFSIAEPREHFPSAPNECGYHGFSYASDSTNFDGDIAIVLSKLNARLHCKIANNDIFSTTKYHDEEDGEEEEDDAISQSGFEDLSVEKIDDSKATELLTIEPSPSFITRVRLLVIRKFTITLEEGTDKYKFTII